MLDLNGAIRTAQSGRAIRDDATMAEGWTVRFDTTDKLLYLFRPNGERYRKLIISDAMRASFQWRTVSDPSEPIS